MSDSLRVSLVIPVFNEATVIETTHARIAAVVDLLPYAFEVWYVDDGSTDGTDVALERLAARDARVRILTLSRNFGHQAALTAGLDHAEGDVVISLDGDGQHPPEMIPQMIALIEQGYDIVQAQRTEEGGLSFKKITSDAFYWLINKISGTRIAPGAADFRALSRQALEALKSMPEYHRFLRGMIAWMGYRSVILPYHEQKRMAGKSKYSLRKMLRLAADAVFSFSLMPLYIGLSAGGVFLLLALAQILYVLFIFITKPANVYIAPGWSSLMAILLIASGIIMILLGFIGVYVGYIFQQVKGRPVYLLKKKRE